MERSKLFENKRPIGIILILFLLTLPFFIKQDAHNIQDDKEKFRVSFVNLEDHNPDYWKKEGLFGNYIREYELKEFRDRNAKHFSDENGNIAVINGGSIHYLDEKGDWQEIDTRIRISQVSGYAFENTHNGIKTWYPDETGESIEVSLGNEFLSIGSNMSLSWENEDGEVLKRQSSTFSFPEADSNKVVYHAFFPEVDNEFEIEPDKVKNKLILKKRPEAKGDFLVLSEQMVLPKGWTVRLNEKNTGEVYETKNGFHLVDELGMPHLYIPAPEVYSLEDKKLSPEELPAKWILEQKGAILTLKMQVAQSWLQDPNLKYPVVLDPTISLYGNSTGYVDATFDARSNSFDRTPIGRRDDGNGNYRSYIQWNIESIPNDSRVQKVSGLLKANLISATPFDVNVNQFTGDYIDFDNHIPIFDRQQLFNDLGRGSTYFSFEFHLAFVYPTSRIPIDYGPQASADLNAQLLAGDNRFRIALAGVEIFPICSNIPCRYGEFSPLSSMLVVRYCIPYSITAHPTDVNTCIGGSASFTAALEGTIGRWQYSSNDGASWIDLDDGGSAPVISGTRTASLSLSNLPASWENYLFRYGDGDRCINGSIWSNSAKLNLKPDPIITSHPQSVSTCEGGNASFSASFEEDINYNWQESLDGGTTWENLRDNVNFSGVNTTRLSIFNVPANFQDRVFRLRGYQGCQENFTIPARLSLTLLPSVALHPSPVNIVQGQKASFTADLNTNTLQKWVYSVDGGVNWVEVDDIGGNNPVFGSTSNTLSLGNVSLSWDGREFALRGFNNSCGPVYTNRALLTVSECEVPTATCNNIIVQLDENGQATITPEQVYSGPPNNCIAEMRLDETTINCAVNSVSLSIIDDQGKETSCSAEVTIENKAPIANCKDVTVQLDATGEVPVLATDFDDGSSAACGDISIIFSLGREEILAVCSRGPSSTFTLIVSDEFGNTSSCQQTLFIEDSYKPVARCLDRTVYLNENGQATYRTSSSLYYAVDNCPSYTLDDNEKFYTLDCSDIGSKFYDITVTDPFGNHSEPCRSEVTVIDRIAPKAICRNVTVQLNGNGIGTITAEQVNNGSMDACGIAEMTLDKTTISCSDNAVILTVKDNNGNESTCTADVTIETTAPIAKCKDVTVQLDKITGETPVLASDFDNGSSASCGDISMIFSFGREEILAVCSRGPSSTFTLIVSDEFGNTSSCEQTLFIEDSTHPEAICDDRTVRLDENGQAIYRPESSVLYAFDNCPSYTLEVVGKQFYTLDCSDIGSKIYDITITDPFGNHSAPCRSEVTVVDRIAPKAICQNVTVQLDKNGIGTVTPEQVNNGSMDACGIAEMTLDENTVSCSNNVTVTLTVKDVNGNESTCSAELIAADGLGPVPDLNSLPDITAECSVNVSSAPTATDNCAGTIIGTTTDPLSYSSQGTHTVTWIFDDGNGNSVTQTQTVIIKDVTAPVPDVTTLPTITGNCEAGLEPPFATDNCAGQVMGSTSDPLYFDKEGIYTITWVYDDGNGNTSSQDQTIVIEDDIAPVPDRQTLPTIRRQCSATVTSIPTATDRCLGTIQGTTSDPLTYNTQGIHIITWIYDDGNGNSVTQTQRVVIRDNKAPVPDQASLPALTGSCSVMITHFPTATDNCAGKVTATTDSPLEFDQEGTFAILWNYDDGNGNTSTQTQWVIVGGDVAPNARCKDISMPMAGNSSVNISASDIDNGSFDDCSSVTLLISPVGGSIFGTGLPPAPSMDLYCKDGKEQNLLLSVTNEKGNTAYCQAKVTLQGTDTDNDGILDSCDNCPDTYNPDQKDSNNNGTGDACEGNSNPDPNPGGWGGWSLKKQGDDQENIITELKAFPNPFQEEVNLSFNLSQEEKTTVEIFNIQGQRVHTLLSELAPKGEHRVLWDGMDQNGQSMPAGIYLVRLRAGKALINQKVILQR